MNRLVTVVSAIAVSLAFVAPACAAQSATPSLAAPPPGSNPVAASILDAMFAIGRATASNPRAAQAAVPSYEAAIQQYAAGDRDGARLRAMQAIVQTDAPAQIQPDAPSTFAQDWYAQMPPVDSVDVADREAQFDLGRFALANCGAPTSPAYVTAEPLYERTVALELGGRTSELMKAVQTIVDTCAVTPPPAANGTAPGGS